MLMKAPIYLKAKKTANFLSLMLFKYVFLLVFSLNVSGQITFNEINYNSDSTTDAGDWVELHNFGTTSVNISNWVFTDSDFSHFYIIPAKVLDPGEYFILIQDTAKFLSQHPSVTNFAGPFNFGLSGKSELIRMYDDLNYLYLSMTYQDSLPWPEGADKNGRTLELLNPLADLNDSENWFDGCMGGSPGTTYTPCTEAIIFSEINYNSAVNMDPGEWVEMRNISSQTIDISNWIFRDKNDSDSFVIPPNTFMDAGNNLVLSGNLNKFNSMFPSVNNVLGSFDFGLKNTNDVIRVYDEQGILYLSVAYYNMTPWPIEANGEGYTLELADSSGKHNDGNNWFKGCIGGSPGTYFSTPCTLNISIREEENISFKSSVYPNPFSNHAYIELDPRNMVLKGEIHLSIYDAIGKAVSPSYIFDLDHAEQNSSGIRLPVKSEELPPGIYYYSINYNGKTVNTGKIVLIK